MLDLFAVQIHQRKRHTPVIRIFAVLVVTVLLAVSLSGCSGSKPAASVADTAITQTPENVARVFAQATFCGDYQLMLSCFPPVYSDSFTESEISKLAAWGQDIQTSLDTSATKFKGTSSSNSIEYASDQTSSLYQDALYTISAETGIAATDIVDIRTCNVRIFCSIDGAERSTDITIMVYKSGTAFYAYLIDLSDTTATS